MAANAIEWQRPTHVNQLFPLVVAPVPFLKSFWRCLVIALVAGVCALISWHEDFHLYSLDIIGGLCVIWSLFSCYGAYRETWWGVRVVLVINEHGAWEVRHYDPRHAEVLACLVAKNHAAVAVVARTGKILRTFGESSVFASIDRLVVCHIGIEHMDPQIQTREKDTHRVNTLALVRLKKVCQWMKKQAWSWPEHLQRYFSRPDLVLEDIIDRDEYRQALLERDLYTEVDATVRQWYQLWAWLNESSRLKNTVEGLLLQRKVLERMELGYIRVRAIMKNQGDRPISWIMDFFQDTVRIALNVSLQQAHDQEFIRTKFGVLSQDIEKKIEAERSKKN